MKSKFLKLLIPVSLIFVFMTNITSAKEIHLNKWEPQGIAKIPNKTSYILGEKLDLTGLKINFVRYIKTGNKVEEETKQVTLFINTIKNGWLLVDNIFTFTEIGNYKVNIQLKLIEPRLQYDLLYPEKVEVDDNNFIINKANELNVETKTKEDNKNENYKNKKEV